MALSSDQRALVHQLGALHLAAMRGDREAVAKCAGIARQAASGDPRATVFRNTIAVIHWKRRDQTQWNSAEALYQRLSQGDALARQQLADLLNRLRQGDESVRPLFSTLKAIHRKQKASAWSGPGQPKTGHYPMPQYHRPGIIVGGSQSYPTMRNMVGCGGIVVGQSYPVLDAVALSNLMGLIARARASIPSDFAAAATAPSSEVPAGGGSQGWDLANALKPKLQTLQLTPSLASAVLKATTNSPQPINKTLAMTSLAKTPSMTQVQQQLRANFVKLN